MVDANDAALIRAIEKAIKDEFDTKAFVEPGSVMTRANYVMIHQRNGEKFPGRPVEFDPSTGMVKFMTPKGRDTYLVMRASEVIGFSYSE
jgi:hypothetical protein